MALCPSSDKSMKPSLLGSLDGAAILYLMMEAQPTSEILFL
jgi:hypothetical protein